MENVEQVPKNTMEMMGKATGTMQSLGKSAESHCWEKQVLDENNHLFLEISSILRQLLRWSCEGLKNC